MTAIECAKILKALGEDTRIQIFDILRHGRKCANGILNKLQITQPTLSHHMKILCDCGIIIAEKNWKWTHYSINRTKLDELLDYLGNINFNEQTECKCKKDICD